MTVAPALNFKNRDWQFSRVRDRRDMVHELGTNVVRSYYIYIMTNYSRTLYVGMTNDLERRVAQHKSKQIPGFTARYNCTILAYYEEFTNINEAIAWEKKIKGWLRAKKIALIESDNPHWDDLAAGWHADAR